MNKFRAVPIFSPARYFRPELSRYFRRYFRPVREQMTPYAKPMECGNHEDVRWLALSGDTSPTLLAQAGDDVMQFSALPYTDEVMNATEYSIDLPSSVSTVVTLASKTTGVGSAGCVPRPLEEYQVWSQ